MSVNGAAAAPPADVALRFHDVTMRYPGAVALSDVSLDVGRGQLRAIIGPNGAGKSTLFGIATGMHIPTAGRVSCFGDDITGKSPNAIARLGIARAFQVARLFTELTVFENVLAAVQAQVGKSWWFFQLLRRCTEEQDRAEQIMEQLELNHVASRRAGTLSQGDKKRLEFAMAQALEPKVLLLDEPTAGMSPSETHQTINILQQLHAAGELTILLTEHDMHVVFALAEEVTVLHQGEVLVTGPPEQVRNDQRVIDVYLGEETEL